jgi:translocation and assembly module TamB
MNSAPKHPSFPDDHDSGPPTPPKRKRHWWRMLGWSILGIICFVIAAVFILAALVDSDGVHQAILTFAQNEATSSLGTRVRLQNFVLHWFPLGLDLYGVTVDGAAPHPAPPLLQVNHIEVVVRIVSIFQQKWYLSSLRIDHPTAWIYVDKNGVSNIPSFQSSGSSSNNNEIFNLGVRHTVLEGGEIYYNSRPSTLAADLYHLDLRAAYDVPHRMYSGKLSYSDGVLKYGAYRPIPHNLDATFSLTPTTFQLHQATLSSGDSQAVVSAVIQNYETNPAVRAQYRIAVDGGQFRQLLNNPTLPTGFIRASGSIQYQKQPNRPLLQSVVLNGDLTSDQLDVNTATAHAGITNVAAHYSLAHGDASLRDLRAGILGGEVTAQGTMTNLGGNSHSNFTAVLHNISLAQLRQQAGESAAMPGVLLAGTLNATASAAWGKTMADLVARADANINGQVASKPAHATTPAVIPVESGLHATYTNNNGQLALANSYIRTTQTDLTLNGIISKHSSLAIRLQANNLRELGEMADSFRRPAPGQQPLDVSGTASFSGTVQGSMTAPHLTGQLTAMNLHVNGSDWKLVRTGVDVSPDHAALENAVLEPAPRGHIALNARATLNKWAFSEQSPLQVQLNASQIAIGELLKFTGEQLPVTGTLRSSVSLHGTALNPEGNGNLDLTGVTAYQQPVNSIAIHFSGNGTEAQANLSVQAPAGSVRANVTVQPKQRTYTAQLTSPGIHINQLAAMQAHNIKANGVLALNASGQGSFDNPQLQATVQSPSLTVSDQTISALKLQLNFANHIANASLSTVALNTPIQAKATVHLSGDYLADASLNTPVLSLQPILALYSPDAASDISGQTQIQATLHGPLKDMKQLEARVTIPVFQVAYQNKIQLAAPTPIQVNYRDGVLDVPEGSIEGTDTSLQFQGHIPATSGQPMSLQLRGAIDLQLAQLFDPEITSSGQIKLNIDSHGVAAEGANLGGEIDIVNANFIDPSLPVGLQAGNGVLKLTTDRINVASFQGKIGGGTVTMQGGVQYRPNVVFAVAMAAKGVRMLYPQGTREEIDARIRLDGTTTHAVLGGTVDLTNLALTPAFDLSSIAGQLSGGVEAPPSQGFTQNLKLNLAVNSTSAINLVSRELSIDGTANLQVRGTAADPVVLGRINLTGGDIILNGNRFVLGGGTIQFVNPMETEPVLNLAMTTTIQQYDINLRLQGPVSQMRPEYSSNPALPAADIIHLLAFGSTTEAAANNTATTNEQAESLVASQVSSQVTSRLSRVAGISQLSISPVLQGGSGEGPAGANITIRQRVTSNLFVTFSTNTATTQNQIIQGQYQISPRVALSATGYGNGGVAVDTLIKKTW